MRLLRSSLKCQPILCYFSGWVVQHCSWGHCRSQRSYNSYRTIELKRKNKSWISEFVQCGQQKQRDEKARIGSRPTVTMISVRDLRASLSHALSVSPSNNPVFSGDLQHPGNLPYFALHNGHSFGPNFWTNKDAHYTRVVLLPFPWKCGPKKVGAHYTRQNTVVFSMKCLFPVLENRESPSPELRQNCPTPPISCFFDIVDFFVKND